MQIHSTPSAVARAALLPVLLLSACAADVEGHDGHDELGVAQHALSADTREIRNLSGQKRYVRHNSNEVKLLLDPAEDDPTHGFWNENHFSNSCGPTAAMNVFKWYGIDDLQHCFWLEESGADVSGPKPPPVWTCRDRATASMRGQMMKTNDWKLAGVTVSGTNTANFRKVFAQYFENYLSDDYAYVYAYEEGDGVTQYNLLWATLEQGHPIVVNYKTGATKGHFATIVGIEKVGNDNDLRNDKIYLANARKEDLGDAISYGKFRDLWRRDYNDFGALRLVGERSYTRINLRTAALPAPAPVGGGGPAKPGKPVQQK